jgi:hypothetical protein
LLPYLLLALLNLHLLLALLFLSEPGLLLLPRHLKLLLAAELLILLDLLFHRTPLLLEPLFLAAPLLLLLPTR